MISATHLSSNQYSTAVRRPANRKSFTTELHRLHTSLAPHIPKLAGPVTRDRSEFGFFDGIPRNALNGSRVAAKLGTVLDLRFLRIPDPERAVCGSRRYQVAGRIPRDGANARKYS